MESKSTFFILIIVVAVLTLALAALAGYIFLVQGSPQKKTEAAASVKVIPNQEDFIIIPLYNDKRLFNLKNSDSSKIAMMQVNISLKCYKQLKNDKKVNVEEKVQAYSDEIQELVVRFFLTLTIDDVKQPSVFDQSKKELKKQINDLLNEGQSKPQDIVYDVIFSQWLFQ